MYSDESFDNWLYVFILALVPAVGHNFLPMWREKCPQAAPLCDPLQTASSPTARPQAAPPHSTLPTELDGEWRRGGWSI